MSDSPEPFPWRSLGHREVLAADFEGEGADWTAVFPPVFVEPVPDFLMEALPVSGWRKVTERPRSDGRPSNELFAAPRDGGWAVASVGSAPGGPPRFMGDMGTYRLRPDQETRRHGLQLSWQDPHRVAVSDFGSVTVTLTNTAEVVWTPDPEDHAFVHGHFLDENGQAPARCQFGYGRYEGEWKGVSLAPGEAIDLPVRFGHDDAPGPGTYGIEAILVSLNLRSSKGILEVVPDPAPDPPGHSVNSPSAPVFSCSAGLFDADGGFGVEAFVQVLVEQAQRHEFRTSRVAVFVASTGCRRLRTPSLQQLEVHPPGCLAGVDPEFLAKPPAQLFVDAHRFGIVAARGQCLHQQPVSALAKRREQAELAARALSSRQFGTGEAKSGFGVDLEGALEQHSEFGTHAFGPCGGLAGEETAPGGEEGGLGGSPRPRPKPLQRRGFRAVNGLAGRFEIDPGVRRQLEPELTAAHDNGHDPANLRHERDDRRVAGLPFSPQCRDEVVTVDGFMPAQDEVRECAAALRPGQRLIPTDAIDFDGHLPADLDS